MSRIFVVVGGQYGSEAKGHVTAQLTAKLAKQRNGRNPVAAVRVAGPNAGHTAYDADCHKFAFRQVPVGVVVAPSVVGVIAAGSEIDPPVLIDEINILRGMGHGNTIYVDLNATLIHDIHKAAEAQAELVAHVGSTGKGIGAARADRLMRKAYRLRDRPELVRELEAIRNVHVLDTADMFHDRLCDEDYDVIIEGTQGYGLGLHGDHYPQCTSSDTRAIDFLAMAGISPWHAGVTRTAVVVVARVFPIRVAGNSGPLAGETTWEDLGLPPEKTTVTQKVRRVGHWDPKLIRDAVRANGGGVRVHDGLSSMDVTVALTMLDQVIPEIAGFDGSLTDLPAEVRDKAKEWVRRVEKDAGTRVIMVGTGPHTVVARGW